jgi:hypothetical protein
MKVIFFKDRNTDFTFGFWIGTPGEIDPMTKIFAGISLGLWSFNVRLEVK